MGGQMTETAITATEAAAVGARSSACEAASARFHDLMRASARDVEASRPVISLIRAEGRLARVFERALASTGVTEVQFNVLMELAANDGRLPLCGLAQHLLKSPANVTALVDRMERDGYVHRVRGERDRRTVLAELTEEGWSALGRAAPAVFATEQAVLASMPRGDRARLASLLDDLVPADEEP
jgi:DNA-binding MarR family transcriptional regulator